MKNITTIVKILSVVSGLAAYNDIIPAKLAPIALLVFATASTLKDLFVKVGDYADDKQINGSFKG